jgi:hypothetical protein
MDFTITELKALAYDILAQVQLLQSKLQQINAAIAKASEAPTPVIGDALAATPVAAEVAPASEAV